MAPSSDENSTTPTPTDPDLQLSLSPMGSPHHPSLSPMPIQLSPPHNHPLLLDHLNQLMSCLSIKTTNNEEVTYVRIPIHPRTLVAWNQMTKTPILPLWLDSSTHRRHRRNGASRTHPLRLDSSISARLSVDPCVKKKTIILLICQSHQLSSVKKDYFKYLRGCLDAMCFE